MNDTHRKSKMSARVADPMDCSKSRGEQALNAAFQRITGLTRAGDKVIPTGFGKFQTREVRAQIVYPFRGANRSELNGVRANKSVRNTQAYHQGPTRLTATRQRIARKHS